MIERAAAKYPHLTFEQADGTKWRSQVKFDAVFSNAALHWMKDAEGAVRTMADSLAPTGRLVVEFGGAGNVEAVMETARSIMLEKGRPDAFVTPWYFPSIGEYTTLLEKHGLEVRIAMLTDRPTRLDGSNGMMEWLRMFGDAMFPRADKDDIDGWFAEIEARLRKDHDFGDHWMLLFRRLRISAVKRA